MNRPHARVICQDIAYDLFPGDLIGRLESAALHINDPHISEAHALLSLRGGALCLLGLRGRLRVAGQSVDELRLQEGQVIHLSPTHSLRVESVTLPSLAPALHVDGQRLELHRDRCALLLGPPRLVDPDHPSAVLALWCVGDQWWARQDGQTARCESGTQWRLPQGLATWGLAPPEGAARTLQAQGPLRWVVEDERVSVHGASPEPIHFVGKMAELLGPLALAGRPIQWRKIAIQIWAGEVPVLRKNYWKQLGDIRARLSAAGLDKELIVTHGGLHELRLDPGDVVEDRRRT